MLKQEAILKAEAKAAEILKEAEAKANASNLKLKVLRESCLQRLKVREHL